MKNEREVTPYTTEIQTVTRDYYKQLYNYKLDTLEEIISFLETLNVQRPSQEERYNMKEPITRNEIESVIKTLNKQKSRTIWIHRNIPTCI